MKRLSLLRPSTLCVALGAALLLPSVSHAGSPQPALSLPEVLARYRAANALAPGYVRAKTRRYAGTTDYGGLHGTYVTISKDPDMRWQENKLGIFDEVSGTDGKVSWQRDSNGNIRLQSQAEQKDERTDQAVSRDEFAKTDEFGGKVALRPQAERKTGCYILDVTPTGGKATTLYIDPQTFLLAKEERLEDDRVATTSYSGYKMMAGRMRATTRRTHVGARKFDEVTTLDSVSDDVAVPDTLFALPATVNNYRWVTPGASSATLPFDYSDKSVALYTAINGRPAYLELDSGSGGIGIARVAADKLKLAHAGVLEGRGYGGSVDEYPIKMDTFELVGGVVFSNVTATSLPLFGDYANYEAVPTIGLMGYDLLSRFVVRVDYAAKELTLIDPAKFQPAPTDGTPLPLDLNDNVPSVAASFDGLPPAQFLVDTGDAGSTVMLYGPYVAGNHLAQKYPRGKGSLGQGVGGEFRLRDVRAHSFSIGGVSLTDVPTQLSLDTQGMGASREFAGALGTDFLSHFTVTFDYPHSRLFFARSPDTAKPFDTRSFGVYVVQAEDENDPSKTSIIIAYIEPDSPASRAGLTRGATLVKVDGQDASVLGLAEVRHLLSAEGGKTSRTLTVEVPDARVGAVSVGGFGAGSGDIKVALYDPLPAH